MKIDIFIELDKDLATAFKAAVRDFSEGIKNLQTNLYKPGKSVSTENDPEPKAKTKQTKPAVKRKPRAKKTIEGTVLKFIKQNKDGISRKELLKKTGFTGRQISDYVYQLKKLQKLEKTKKGLFKPL